MPLRGAGENPVFPRTFNPFMGHSMSRLPTTTSAMTALTALTPAEQNLHQVENQVATGLANSTAADNPAYWPIASKMTSNAGALGAVNDALGENQPLVSTMSSALKPTISVMDAIKNDLVTASQPGADLNEVETDIAARQQSLLSVGGSANFNGRNRLETTGGNFNLVGSRDSTNGVSSLTVDTTNTAPFNATTGATSGSLGLTGESSGTSILPMNITAATAGDLCNVPTDAQTAIGSVTPAASALGATTANLTTQRTYVSNLSDSLTTDAGSLVDANMNEAATKIAAVQVQQPLGEHALSISNSNTLVILKLFEL
jgi:flagellin